MLPLIVSVVLGALLGIERSVAGKHAGMRTYALVSLGSCLFAMVGVLASYQLGVFSGVSPLQLAGSVAIGIGFIGAGLTALHLPAQTGGEHAELTTAAGIWVAAAVGIATGFELYAIAIVSTILGLLIFSVFTRLEPPIGARYHTKQVE